MPNGTDKAPAIATRPDAMAGSLRTIPAERQRGAALQQSALLRQIGIEQSAYHSDGSVPDNAYNTTYQGDRKHGHMSRPSKLEIWPASSEQRSSSPVYWHSRRDFMPRV
jgi:hypothetical protein